MEPTGPDLDAGAFGAWLDEIGVALDGGGETDVPCGPCTACCTASQFVLVEADEADSRTVIPPALLVPAPGRPGDHLLGYDERGRCPLLGEAGCTIYAHRPRTCRTYDCRVFAAADVVPDAPLVAERAGRWRFSGDGAEQRAVRAAARDLAASGRPATAVAVEAVRVVLRPMTDEEVPLAGGNVTAGVVRVGDTVRRPAGPWTPAVHALLTHLHDVGFDGAPRSFGLDGRGRHVVEWIDGGLTHPYRPGADSPSLEAVGRLVRRFHEAAAGFVPPVDAAWGVVIPPADEDQVVHHDLAAWNFVHGAGRAVLIDWDAAGPGTRLGDLAWAALGFTELRGDRLRRLVDGYGLDEGQRRALVALLPGRYQGMVDLLRTGGEPWSRLAAEGHLAEWRRITARAEAAAPDLLAALLA